MKRQLNIILNGKGGVGKSFFATNLVHTHPTARGHELTSL